MFEEIPSERAIKAESLLKPEDILSAIGAQSAKEMEEAHRAIAELEEYKEDADDFFLEAFRDLEKASEK